ncbi:hypothetical protein H6G97_40805 [Nostoc flagelliforme FACHB-838]|uniref:Uncharacterized protein n=1 Tax=Nostoc flagelliforme FACHB-838 TaxID=2692904 RepID=A0ABR8E2C0_9NOSO|nr:hypothetical protein [Nostoc flagelliforme]MBD2535400.1 hypothetical protein [Nostoc flagelliforme FACHB-838]
MASAEFTSPESTQAVPTVETPLDEEQVNTVCINKTTLYRKVGEGWAYQKKPTTACEDDVGLECNECSI